MSITKIEKVFNGTVTNIKPSSKCLVVTLFDNVLNIEKEFHFFDLLRFTNQLQLGDCTVINYIENKHRGKIYNKATHYTITPQCNHVFIHGTIKNLKNSRGKDKKKNEVAFTLKEFNSDNVSYCYINKLFKESMWFKKDQNVVMEVIPILSNCTHSSYRVISLWGR